MLAGLFTGATAGDEVRRCGAAAVLAVGALVVLWRRLTVRGSSPSGSRARGRAPVVRQERDRQGRSGAIRSSSAGTTRNNVRRAGRRSTTSGTDTRCSTWCCCCRDCSPTRSRSTAPSTSRRCSSCSPRWRCSTLVHAGSPGSRSRASSPISSSWFSSVQDARYLLPAMPVLAVLAAVGIVALAREGKLGRTGGDRRHGLRLCGRRRRLGRVRVAVRPVPRGPPERGGVPARERLVQRERGVAEREPAARQRVVVDHAFLLHIEPDALTLDLGRAEDDAGPAETREFVRRYGMTHAIVFRASTNRERQLRTSVRAGSGALLTRPISSRTRHEVGAPQRMDVYEIPRPR